MVAAVAVRLYYELMTKKLYKQAFDMFEIGIPKHKIAKALGLTPNEVHRLLKYGTLR